MAGYHDMPTEVTQIYQTVLFLMALHDNGNLLKKIISKVLKKLK